MTDMKLSIRLIFCFLLAPSSLAYVIPSILSDGLNDFGFRFYKGLSKGNNVYSTLATSTALTGLLQGSDGSTAEEIMKTLGYQRNNQLSLTRDQVIPYLHAVLAQIRMNRCGYNSSTQITIPSNVNAASSFQSTVEDELFITLTGGKSSGEIALGTAINFTGIWKYQFDTKRTKSEPFYVNGGRDTVNVPMMYMKGYFRYCSDIDMNAELLEIPFAGDNLTMVIILPKEMDGIGHQRLHLNTQKVRLALVGLSMYGVHLRVPKFKVLTSSSILKQLERVGIRKATRQGDADFSLISQEDSLVLTKADSMAMIDISETGSMAAPPTNISDGMASTDYDEPLMTYFTVDRPFHFLIRHIPSDLILSVGQVLKPSVINIGK